MAHVMHYDKVFMVSKPAGKGYSLLGWSVFARIESMG